MRLRLELKNATQLPGARQECVLERGSVVIGRSLQADWILPDPERIISKIHCRIDGGPNGFTVIDTSVNGSILDGTPIARGLPRSLGDGSVLQLGKATIGISVGSFETVQVPDAPQSPHPASSPGGTMAPQEQIRTSVSASGADAALDGPFGRNEIPQQGQTAHSGVVAPSAPAVLQDWWNPAAQAADTSTPADQATSPSMAALSPVAAAATVLTPAGPATFAELVRSRAALTAPNLATLVAKAAETLPDEGRQRLFKRLEDLVREASG